MEGFGGFVNLAQLKRIQSPDETVPNEAAKQMNEAKRQLFKTIFEQGRRAV